MEAERKALERLARGTLSGKNSHVEMKNVFSGLEWQDAGLTPHGVAHSVYQILEHMSFWKDWVLRWLAGERPAVPTHASESWPSSTGPAGEGEWEEAVRRFRRGLRQLERASQKADVSPWQGGMSRLDMLQIIGSHNSYHAGQVAFLRQLLGKWPPPSGGAPW